MNADGVVRLGVDVGGTFTDVVLLADEARTTAKVPTTDDQSRGVLAGIEAACDAAGLDPAAVDQFRHATTVSVNAMLEQNGARTALVTTGGFRDVLEIGRQNRPALYDLTAERPTPLVPRARRVIVDERVTPDGIERSLDEGAVDDVAADVAATDAESVAVCLLHAYADPTHERRLADALRDALDLPVTASHEVLAAFREYERTATTVADAYLTPVVDAYLGRLGERADDRGLPAPRVMQANGGIAAAETVRESAVTTVLSGPAAGVVGSAAFEDHAGADATGLVTFDMGGTSTDVSLVRDGAIERTSDADVGGYPVRIPMVDVNTVGAGGGSLGWVDAGGALRVGPESAGAEPGPACYGKGGTEPAVTDAALQLGYLGADTTLGADLTLDADAAETALEGLADEAGLADALAAARGVYRVANATMTRAIRGVTVERGHDPREFALAAFGGAGPMHAAALADRLGIERVVVPPTEGVLSAFGLLAADESHDAVRTHRTGLAEADPADIEAVYDDLAATVLADATDPDAATVERTVDCRYAGQSFEVSVPAPTPFDAEVVTTRFHDAHERVRGYRMESEPVDVVTLGATATIPGDTPTLGYDPTDDPNRGERDVFFAHEGKNNEGRFHETPVYDRDRVPPGDRYEGPAVFEGGESTVVCPPDWTVRVADDGALVLEVAR